MTDFLDEETAFIASSFVEFHTQEPEGDEYIPMSDEEAQERFFDWLSDYVASETASVHKRLETAEEVIAYVSEVFAGCTVSPSVRAEAISASLSAYTKGTDRD